MENEQYLYFVIRKEQLEQVTIKKESFLHPDIYIIKVKNFHSYWHDRELEFSTEIIAESQYFVLLQTTVKWYDHNIISLTMHSDRFCEIHYGLDSYVVVAYYTDKNVKHAFIEFKFKNVADTISEWAKNNNIKKENKDMPPYKHHINPGTPGIYFGDCTSLHYGMLQEAKHVIVKDIKFNGPATIIFYEDGSKEVVKCQKNDKNDKEKAIYMAMLKHKNKKLFSIINKALSSEDPEKALAYELIKYEGGDAKLLHQLCNDFIKAEKPKKKTKTIKKVNK